MDPHATINIRLNHGDRHESTAGREDNHLSSSFTVDYDGRRVCAAWNPGDEAARDDLQKRLDLLRAGRIRFAHVPKIDRALRSLLLEDPTAPLALAPDVAAIQISVADGADPRLITNLPWEMIRSGDPESRVPQPELVDNTLASFPVVRVLPGKVIAEPPLARLRALLCVVNPPAAEANSAGEKQFQPILLTEYLSALQVAFGSSPMISTRWPNVPDHALHREHLFAQIETHKPPILVLVTHGRSGARVGDEPQVLCADGWVPVYEIAKALRRQLTALVFLICCDLAKSASGPAPTSAAAWCIHAGVAEVVAMQGNVEQGAAGSFLKTFLIDLLTRHSVSLAAAAGRRGIRMTTDAFLPTVFRNSKRDAAKCPLVKVLGGYRAALNGLIDLCP